MQALRRLRKARGMKQWELADASGVDRATISQIETGRREPTLETLEKLAPALDAEVADFFPRSQSRLFPPDGGPGIPIRELEALRRWVGYLEPRMRTQKLDQAGLDHELDAALAFGLERAVRLPAEDHQRFYSLVRTMLSEAREFAGLRAELRDLQERLEAG